MNPKKLVGMADQGFGADEAPLPLVEPKEREEREPVARLPLFTAADRSRSWREEAPEEIALFGTALDP